MDSWYGFLKIALLIYGAYSVFSYFVKRDSNKVGLDNLRHRPVLRQLSDEEVQALKPFVSSFKVNAGRDVYALTGALSSHGLSVQGSLTTHVTLDDVDVLLPYDAADYAQDHNYAEVVLADKCAIVVTLNDFQLLEGRARAFNGEQILAQPVAENPETLLPAAASAAESVAPSGRLSSAVAASTPAAAKQPQVQVIRQRHETAEEVRFRLGSVTSWDGAVYWLLAVLLLWGATWDFSSGVQTALLVAGVLSGLWALWRWLGPRKKVDEKPLPVSKVRGLLLQFELKNPSNTTQSLKQYFVGDQVKLEIPHHWEYAPQGLPMGQEVEVDVREPDGTVLNFGKGWSQADEWRRLPGVSWGGKACLLLIGLLGLLVLVLTEPRLADSAHSVERYLKGERTQVYESADALMANMPAVGSTVRLTGRGTCHLNVRDEFPTPDCTRVRWGGEPVTAPDLAVPEVLQALAGKQFWSVRLEDDPEAMMTAMVFQQMQRNMHGYGNGMDPSLAWRMGDPGRGTVAVWQRVGESMSRIDEACASPEGLSKKDCDALKQRILKLADKDGDDRKRSPDDWDALKQSISDEDLRTNRSDFDSLQYDLRRALDDRVRERFNQVREQVKPAHGGVVIKVPESLKLNVNARGESGEREADEAISGYDIISRWKQFQKLAAQTGTQPFDLHAVVASVDKSANGEVRLSLDPSLLGRGLVLSVAEILLAVFAFGLIFAGLIGLILRLPRSMRRSKLLRADVAQRPNPGQPEMA